MKVSHRIGEPARPRLVDSRGRAQRDDAGERVFFGAAHRLQIAKLEAASLVIMCDAFQRAVEVDRLVVAGIAEERDQALCLAERIDADEMRAIRK